LARQSKLDIFALYRHRTTFDQDASFLVELLNARWEPAHIPDARVADTGNLYYFTRIAMEESESKRLEGALAMGMDPDMAKAWVSQSAGYLASPLHRLPAYDPALPFSEAHYLQGSADAVVVSGSRLRETYSAADELRGIRSTLAFEVCGMFTPHGPRPRLSIHHTAAAVIMIKLLLQVYHNAHAIQRGELPPPRGASVERVAAKLGAPLLDSTDERVLRRMADMLDESRKDETFFFLTGESDLNLGWRRRPCYLAEDGREPECFVQ
jgi:hypothetical protein